MALPLLPAAAADAARAPAVVLYDGLGTTDGALLSGRVVESAAAFAEGRPGESMARKVKRSLGLLRIKPVAGESVEVRLGSRSFRAKTDDRGYFDLHLGSDHLRGLREREHRVLARVGGTKEPSQWSEGSLFLWPRRGTTVISDLDDTLIESNVHRKLLLTWRTLTSNAHDLQAVDGMPELFRRLRRGGFATIVLTSTPSPLYTRVRRGLEIAGYPKSPVFMRKLGHGAALPSHVDHKLERLDTIARLLPNHRFILLGDPNNDDQEIFDRWARRNGRVLFIGIRHLGDHAPVDRKFRRQRVFRDARQLASHLRAANLIGERSFGTGRAAGQPRDAKLPRTGRYRRATRPSVPPRRTPRARPHR